ncbi:hypothetical protein TanjilG_17952 [Lupinus angustifolius]|uniref:NAB domain-containing protein n=1 Tax=Lupinus angustifolius TaxID=3871 RepID=A0A1J7GDY7_LUPAN|nr:PREDICTED: protein NETWORKED 1A-like [Lupinus angustifolius]OIV92601.1 hypothetical protein TanjilG_17952 [Lupinus angustifolius]
MANLSNTESKPLYSWWWDSHFSPKNSKWLQENLTDIDAKVKAMIKLIEEDADSFARRAEMYYKKRPELIKLVEEFYRAYRALAERYDHATFELRHAHKTMAKAFPSHAPHYMLIDDLPCDATESHTQGVPPPVCASLKPVFEFSPIHNLSEKNTSSSEEFEDGESRKGLKHNVKSQSYSESEHTVRAESEVQNLRKALVKMQSDKDAIFLQYQKSLEKLSEMERDLITAQKDAGGLNEGVSKSEIEIKILKETLADLKSEKDELTRLEADKDAGLLQCEKYLEKISLLEAKITLSEENSRLLNKQIERAELEVKALRKSLAQLNEEKESVIILYHQCLEKISKMESEILLAQENSKWLNREVDKGAEKLKSAEKHCDTLENLNQSFQVEAENLVQKIAMKDQELLKKQAEIDKLQTQKHDEHSHFLQFGSTLQDLQKLYSQAQQEQRTLTLELQYGLQLLKDLEFSKQGFKEEIQEIVEENMTLHELNFSSTRSLKKQQMEISKLKAINDYLEGEFDLNTLESNALQRETRQIKDDIQDLNNRYQAMLEQLQTLGLNPKCFAAFVKDLQNENSKLKEVCEMERDEKEALCEKSKDIDQLLIENAFMEFSLYSLNDELDGLKAAVNKYQESCLVLHEEKSIVVAEKSTLLSQLQIITESVPTLLEKNTLLEKSLSDAENELRRLEAKSRSLQESCKFLDDEKCNILNKSSILVSQLESVEARLGNLEKKFTELEEKYYDVEKIKESTGNKVQELHASILVQQEKHSNHEHSSEARLTNLENVVNALQEEQRLRKTKFEEELDKAVNAQLEILILRSCIEDLEHKNLALLIECEENAEASKFSDKLISELENENLMQLMEVEFLLHEIKKFNKCIHQMCGALQVDQDSDHGRGTKQDEIPTSHILKNIEDLKSSLVKSQEEKHQLLVENSVLLTSLSQHLSEGEKLESDKRILEQEIENTRQQNELLQINKVELMEMNMQLRSSVANGEEKENTLKTELEALHAELIGLRTTNQVFQEQKGKLLEEKNSLLKIALDLKNALSTAEDENSAVILEVLALSNLNLVYECIVTERVYEQKTLSDHLSNLSHLNSDLKQEIFVLSNKLEVEETQNAYLIESIEKMDEELKKAKNANSHLTHQIENSENLLMRKEAELFEMEKRLKTTDILNAEFCRYNEELKMERQESRMVRGNLERQVLELSENCTNHKKEIEQHRVREETLNTQLRDRTDEVELWEAEAAAFYSDLQILSISEALLEGKVTELTGVCKRLDDESASKSLVIEQMTERVKLLESEIGAYIPIITSLKEDFASLEHTSLLWTNKTRVACNGEQKGLVIETCCQENGQQNLRETRSTSIPDHVSDFLSIKARIRAIEKVMMKEIEGRVKEEHLSTNVETRAWTEGTKCSNLEVATYGNRKRVMELKELNAWKTDTENWLLMKDIPLDHNSEDDLDSKCCKRENRDTGDLIVELCETDQLCCAPPESHNSERFGNYSSELEVEKELSVDKLELSSKTRKTDITQDVKKTILERLASDAQKLAILNMTVQDLKKKKPMTEKKGSKGSESNDIEHETVKRQIEQVAESIKQLADINDRLSKDIKASSSSSAVVEHIERRRVTEQARQGSEQIGRLQFEVQNIEYILLKFADEKNNKGKNRLSRKTGVLLRDFIHIGKKKNNRRGSKNCLCGCSRPSTNED